MAGEPARNTNWLQPAEEEAGLQRYLEILRTRAWIIVATVAFALVGAIAYLVTADPVYEGEADLLVTPISDNDATLSSLVAIVESTDPTRDVETGARLTTTLDVAERVRGMIDTDQSARELLNLVSAEPVAQSNVVQVTAQDDTAEGAARLANAFARASVAERTDSLHTQIDTLLPGLAAELRSNPSLSVQEQLGATIARLETLRNGPDPTLRLETRAQPPEGRVSPKPALTIVGALVAGLIAGAALAYLVHALDRRLRHEDQLRRRFHLPILARIPREKERSHPLSPREISAPAIEGYRTLRASVATTRARGGPGRVVLVTGGAPGDGKTTSAVNLATSLAASGRSTILIESDLRHPTIGATLGVEASLGIVSVLIENASLSEALVEDERYHGNLRLLLAEHRGAGVSELLGLPTARGLIAEARELADFVIIDSPPLATVIDAMPLAHYADDVLIVTRLGSTPLDQLMQLAELFQAEDITPAGFVLLGVARPTSEKYYYQREGNVAQSPFAGNGGRRQPGQRLTRVPPAYPPDDDDA